MFVGRVARGYPPYCTRRKANQSAEPKRCTPSVMSNEPGKQGRGEATARANTCEDETIDEAAFLDRDPTGDKLVCRRIDDCLACTQGKPDRDQQHDGVRDARGKERGESGCNPPPQNPDGKDTPRPEARREPSCRKLKAGVSDQEGAEDPAQPLIA